METRSVSPTIAPPSEAPKDEQESSHDQSTSESIVQSEEGLQEAPEKKQKLTKTRSKPKTVKKVPIHKHKKGKPSNEPPSDSIPPSSSPSLPPPPPLPLPSQTHSSSDHPSESDTIILLDDDDDDDAERIAEHIPVETRSPESFGAAKVVSQSEMSPAALAIWKDILRKEVQLHELSKKAEAVMSVLNSQIEICRSLGVDVLSLDHKISDLMEFKAIHKKH